MTSRTQLLTTVSTFAAASRGRQQQNADGAKREAMDFGGTFEDQINKMSIITGTPKTVIPKVKQIIRGTTMIEAREVARQVLAMEDPDEATRFMAEVTRKVLPPDMMSPV